jgi:predicted  nucleic acid-binding Zn-ribbon protein
MEIREEEEEVTVLKEQAIDLGLQMEGIDKELVDLKADFDREEKKINERSTKYK